MTFNPTEESVHVLADCSPKKIYGNSVILENIVDNLEKAIKKIIFKKLTQYKSTTHFYEFLESISRVI